MSGSRRLGMSAALVIASTLAVVADPVGRTSAALATDTQAVASTITADTLDPPSTLRCNGATSCTTTFLNKPS